MLCLIVFRIKKIFGRLFSFVIISARKNHSTLVFFSENAPSKALQKLYEQIPITKQKSLRNIFLMRNTAGHSTVMWPIHFEYGRHHRNKSIEICPYNFYRAFYGASSEKKSRLYWLFMSEIFSKYWMLQSLCRTRYNSLLPVIKL